MILLLDLRNDTHRIGVIDGKIAKWYERTPEQGGFRLFDVVAKKHGFARKPPSQVGMTRYGVTEPRAGAGASGGAVSWSAIRYAVAMVNGFGFAWNVPVFAIEVSVDDAPDALAEKARKAAKKAKAGQWVRAVYSGEPNITLAKPLV